MPMTTSQDTMIIPEPPCSDALRENSARTSEQQSPTSLFPFLRPEPPIPTFLPEEMAFLDLTLVKIGPPPSWTAVLPPSLLRGQSRGARDRGGSTADNRRAS